MRIWMCRLTLALAVAVYASAQRPQRPWKTTPAAVEEHPEPAPATTETGSSATVSLQQLKHRIPRKAAKEFRKGIKLYGSEDYEQAERHFEQALIIDPE